MTLPASNKNKFTKFSLWLRKQKELDSSREKGYVATDLDFVWRNYLTGKWMLIEEKTYMAEPSSNQKESFRLLHGCIIKSGDKNYKGLHLIQFEHETPEDGKIFLNRKEITKEELFEFLTFGELKAPQKSNEQISIEETEEEPHKIKRFPMIKTKEQYDKVVASVKTLTDKLDKIKGWNSDDLEHKKLVQKQQMMANAMLEYETEHDLLPDYL